MKHRIILPIALFTALGGLYGCTQVQSTPTEMEVPKVPTDAAPLTTPPTIMPGDTPMKNTDSDDDGDKNEDTDKDGYKTPNPTTIPIVKTPITTPQASNQSITKTGTVTYNTPGGPDDVYFSVTIKNNIITAASSTPKAEHGMSIRMQNNFANAVSSAVVGKSIKNLQLDAVGGASLTTAAFEKFVAASF